MLKRSLARLHQTLPMLGLAVLGSVSVAIAPAQAQTADGIDPLEAFQTQDGDSDILGGNGQQGLQDLIHRINLAGEMSMEEFVIQRQDNITSEADRFRQLQLDRINVLQFDTQGVETDFDLDSAASETEI